MFPEKNLMIRHLEANLSGIAKALKYIFSQKPTNKSTRNFTLKSLCNYS